MTHGSKSKMHVGIESCKPCPQIVLVSRHVWTWQNSQSQSPSRVEEYDVGKAWTDTLSNKELHQLKQQCEGAKKRKSLMYYIL